MYAGHYNILSMYVCVYAAVHAKAGVVDGDKRDGPSYMMMNFDTESSLVAPPCGCRWPCLDRSTFSMMLTTFDDEVNTSDCLTDDLHRPTLASLGVSVQGHLSQGWGGIAISHIFKSGVDRLVISTKLLPSDRQIVAWKVKCALLCLMWGWSSTHS